MMTSKIKKYNKYMIGQSRNFVITNVNIYNFNVKSLRAQNRRTQTPRDARRPASIANSCAQTFTPRESTRYSRVERRI